MKDLIHDLLKLTALSRKRGVPDAVDLNQVVAQVERDLDYAISEKNATITVASPLPTVVCDRTRIQEVLKNLLSNAIKFTTSTPLIAIACREDGDGYTVSVADNGIGIAPAYHDRIFGLFERLHPQEEFEGTGAGLAICKKAIESHGGRIWVESALGRGSTFYFTLPPRSLGQGHQAVASGDGPPG
jgi:light-regulated signal transduction histidine kinase (bacteriophytochrome)